MTFNFATANGSASSGGDYTGVTNVIAFAAGEVATNVLVAIADDVAVEGDETVALSVFGPGTGALVFNGSLLQTNALLTIVDDEIELAYTAATYSVAENAGTAIVDVVRTGVTNALVSVSFAVTSGTAIDGLDYVSTNGVLNFGAGVRTQSFTVVISDNTVFNANRTVNLALSSPSGAVGFNTQLGAVNTAVLTIVNEDPVAVAGTRDPSFGATVNGTVYGLAINTNTAFPAFIGKPVLAGDFTTVNGLARNRIARLNRNGTLDTTFNPGLGANDSVRAVAVQPDGRVVIGGFFTSAVGVARNYVARLNSDGTLDASFNPGAGPDGQVNALVLQPDGKVVIGGQFTTVDGVGRNFIARLNSDGSLDTTFVPGAGASSAVRALALLADGSLIVGGDFQFFNGNNSRGLARVGTNGVADTLFSFNLGVSGINGSVVAVAVQQGTNLVVGGTFVDVGGTPRQNLARFGTNGILDVTFTAAADNTVNTVAAQPDGKLLVGGGFTTVNGVARSRSARLTQAGVLDPTINFGSGADNDITVSLVQFYDAQIVFGGAFSTFGGTSASRLVRLNGGDNAGAGVFEFSQTNYTVSEASLATLTVIRSGGLNGTATVDAFTTNGTATLAGGDYLTNFVTLSFAPGVNQLSFVVTNLDDTQVEGNETVNLALVNATGGAVLGAVSNSTLTLADNDARLAFTIGTFNASESAANATITLVRTGGTNGTVTVDFATAVGGTATVGVDYLATNGTITFADGVVAASFNVRLLGDSLVEGNETVQLGLSNPNGVGAATAVLGTINAATLVILDDDFSPGTLALSTNAFSVAENAGSVLVTLTRTGGTLGLVSVNYGTTNGSAVAGSDFTAVNGTLSWPDGDAGAKSFSITINDDGTLEGNETFIVGLAGVAGGATLGSASAVVTIIDDDGVVQLASANFVVLEDATNAVVTVNRTGGLTDPVPVVVDIATVAGGTAIVGSDYVATNGTVTFAMGVSSQTFHISILNDQLAEPNETINLLLGPITSGSAILGSLVNATITIVDNDIAVQFASTNFTVLEAGPNVTITVTRTGATNASVSVSFDTSDGSAVSGADYQPQIGTLVFAVGETSKTFSLTILDDSVVEPDETVNLRLSTPTGGAVLGTPATATLTIINDDTGVEFAAASFTVVESQTNATITINRLGVTNTAFNVDFATSNNTAVAGVNYTATNGSLVFNAGVLTRTFAVRVTDDAVPLGDKTVNLHLFNATSGAVLGNQSTASLVITDDEVTLQFSAATYSVLEDQTNAVISVTRIGSGGGTVGVSYSAVAGSATAGTDFTVSGGTLSFPTGVTNVTVLVPLLDDIVSETNETVLLALASPTGGATLGAVSNAVLRIVDNERVGSVDSLFLSGVGADNVVQAVAIYSNPASTNFGKVIIGGDFQTVAGTSRLRLARLNADGTLDTSFNPGQGVNNVVYAVAIQSDDQVLIGGAFNTVAGVARGFVARLNNDGTVDASYNVGNAGANSTVLALALQPDGRLLIGGTFTTYNGTARARLARLATDGTLDATFNPGSGASDTVFAIGLEAGGNVVVGGVFNNFAGVARNQLARLTSTGALDATFAPAFSVGAQVYALGVQPNGNILVAGSFTNVGAFSRTNVARLTGTDGSIDPSFSSTAAANSTVRALALEASGKILVGGDFTTLNGTSRIGFGRLNSNGTLDAGYDPGIGISTNGSVFSLATQSDGKGVVAGNFVTADGVGRGNVARINGDHGVIQFVTGTASVLERGGSVTLSVSRLSGSSGSITVNFGTTNGTALGGADFGATNGTLTFGPGITNQNIVIPVLNDTAVEGNESFTVGLQGIVGGSFGATTISTVTILDDDSTLQFAVAATNVLEDIGTLVLTVVRTGVIDTLVTLPFNTADGSALSGVDYTGDTNTLTFGTNVASQTISIPVLNDRLEEGTETFTVVLGTPGGEASLGTNTTTVVTLLDNDSTLFFTTNATMVFESAGSVTLNVGRTGYTNNVVSADFTTLAASALAGSDYVGTSGSLIFALGVTNNPITVVIINDQLEESTESFNVRLTNVVGEASFSSVTNVAVTVLDNDSTLELTVNSATVVESVGSVTFTVSRTGFLSTTVTLPFSTLNGSATAGADFTATTNVLTFATNVSSQQIIVPIVNDTVVESTEAFTLQLYTPGGEASLGTRTLATITITDDDSTLQFSAATAAVAESTGSITLTVDRAGDANSTVAVQFTTANGSAFAGQDYTATNGTLTFGTNVISRTISVTILNDTVVEPDETFSVGLSGATGESSVGANGTNVVTIVNDDSTLQFSSPSYQVVERIGAVTLTVNRSGATNSVVTVPYATANVTAFAGADYTLAAATLTFATNEITKDIVVTVLNDKLSEGDETFSVTLGTPGGEASLGVPSSAVVTILDDESILEFASTNVTTILESGGQMNLTVTRVGVIDTTVTLAYAFGNVSATNGVDYAGTDGTLTFGPNVNSQVITANIINDLIIETNKTFTVTLSAPTGEALIGSGRVVTVTILDDDSTLQFPFSQLNVAESGNSLAVTVQRTGATNVAVGVDLATADGLVNTATANVDYSAVTTNLVFAIGQTAASVTLYLTNDSTEEGTETFRVLLSNPTNQATLGSQTVLTVSIIDDDFRTIVPAGFTLTAESFVPANNAVDPLERVTMNFSLRNVGNVHATNITATLLATNGVMSPSAPQIYTNLNAGGAALALPFSFTATQAQTITATLQLSDDRGTIGTAAFTIDLGVPNSFTNRSLINIPATLSLPSSGPAGPYPSTITVSNVTGVVNKVTVKLSGFSHTYPADVDVLLVGPNGQKVLLMSDAGGSFSASGLNLTFDDAATAGLPDTAQLVSGSFRPTDYAPADSFPAPAPAGPYASTLSAFRGFSPNGVWSLYINDDTDINFGNIVNGWTLSFNTVNAAVDVAAVMTNSAATVTAPGTVTFTTVITNNGPNIATGLTYSNVLPAGLSFVSATSSAGTVANVSGTVVANLGTLGVGSNHIVSVTVATSGSGPVVNTAQVFSGEVELNSANNTASSTVTIAQALNFTLYGAVQLGGQFSLTVSNAVVGRTYVVEVATNLAAPVINTVWTPLGTNVAAGSSFTITDTGAAATSRRFYRAIER